MSFASVSINNLRNIAATKIIPAKKFNVFYGANGSGKTSLLEALYYLSLGKSFRTHLNSRIISHDSEHLSLFANLYQDKNLLPIGVQRHNNGEIKIRINQENATSMLEIAKMLPIQVLNSESQDILTGSSKLRRRFMDWGVFHVEPSFLSIWQQAQRALKQRNAALKTQGNRKIIELWDRELETVSEQLNNKRREYLNALEPILFQVLAIFFKNHFDFSFRYKTGWDEEIGLKNTLKRSIERDIQLGHTQHGPHRTDILIRINKNIPAQDVLSQGQQKLLVYALHLAQGVLLREQAQKSCVFLLDDLPAELDIENRQRVTRALDEIEAQTFITGVDRGALSTLEGFSETQVFHVEHGTFVSG